MIGMLRSYFVFNVSQCDGLKEPEPIILPEDERHAAVEQFIAATNADIRTTGNQPMFVPSLDCIHMPLMGQFKNPASFYATSLHELGHWTGAEKRLNRNLAGRFGTKAYAAEELVAELTSAFLCAHLAIEGELRHAGYIGNWLELLRSDERAIFTAASKASQAADYLKAFSQPEEGNDDGESPDHDADGRAGAVGQAA